MRLTDVLPVRWFDGLVVNELHLKHQDFATRSALSALAANCVDQPGLLAIGDESVQSSTVGVVLEPNREPARDSKLRFRIQLAGLWLAPSGKLIVVIPRVSGEAGISLEASAKSERREPLVTNPNA